MKYYLIKTSGLDPIRIEYCYWDKKVDVVELTEKQLKIIDSACKSSIDTETNTFMLSNYPNVDICIKEDIQDLQNKVRKVLDND